MLKKILKIGGIALLGILGGALFEILFLPTLLGNQRLARMPLLRILQREVVNNPVQQIIIQEGDGLKQVVSQVAGAVLRLGHEKDDQLCGFALTTDGIVLAPIVLAQKDNDFLFVNGSKIKFKIIKKDQANGLALLKLDKSGLKTVSFVDMEKSSAGEKVFLLRRLNEESPDLRQNFPSGAQESGESSFLPVAVNEGVVTIMKKDYLETNIIEEESFDGCPAFNFRGEFFGLSKILDKGKAVVLPNFQIRSFAQF